MAVTSRYRFHGLLLLGEKYVLATPVESFTVDRLVADFTAIEAKTGKKAIVLVPELSPHFRKALIAKRVPFLLDGKQAFLPFVYLNLTASKPIQQTGDFTPSTQLVFLALLYSAGESRSQEDLGKQLGLSAMSVSRAVDQLVGHGLVEVTTTGRTGRRKIIRVPHLAGFYCAGMPYFGKVVKQAIYVVGELPLGLPRSGLDALSERTMLGPPAHPCFAASHRRRPEFAGNQIDWHEAADRKDSFRIDLLSYDPSPLAEDGIVDPVTMLLTIDEHDERIDQAIADYMKGVLWYSD
ncbi:MAG: MarR family transcriptional regulator [Propionibacteriaceae bacterium]|nr:MarR family transcriptional regulator [Propionibacteriaceae bacterium]